MADVLQLLEAEPELGQMNAGIQQNEGYLKSLDADRQFIGAASSHSKP